MSLIESPPHFFDRLESRLLLSASLVSDVSRAGIRPQSLASDETVLFFTGETQAHGRELWTSDGTAAGTRMVADLTSGSRSTQIRNLVVAGSKAFFVVGKSNSKLYVSDGSRTGTFSILRIPDAKAFHFLGDFGDGTILFTIPDGAGTHSLYRSNGTIAGTNQVQTALPYFTDVAIDEVHRRMLGLAGENASSLFQIEETKQGTREIDVGGIQYGVLASSMAGLYFISKGDESIRLYFVDGNARVNPLPDVFDQASIGGVQESRYAWIAGSRKDEAGFRLYRADGTKITSFDYANAPFDPSEVQASALGLRNDEFGVIVRNPADNQYRVWFSDNDTQSMVERFKLTGASDVLAYATSGDAFVVLGASSGRRNLWWFDATTNDVRQINLSRDGSGDGDLQQDILGVGDHLVTVMITAIGTRELVSFDADHPDGVQITSVFGSSGDSDIVAHSTFADRSVVVTRHASANTLAVQVIDENGVVYHLVEFESCSSFVRIHMAAASNGIYLSFTALDHPTVPYGVNGASPTDPVNPNTAKGYFVVARIDPVALTVSRLFEHVGFGNLYGVTGRKLFFTFAPLNLGSTIWSTTGTKTSTNPVAGTFVGFTVQRRILNGRPFGFQRDSVWTTDASLMLPVKLYGMDTSSGSGTVQSIETAGSVGYFATETSLFRTDGTVGGTSIAATLQQLAPDMERFVSLKTSSDGRWLYIVVAKNDGYEDPKRDAWRLLRVAVGAESVAQRVLDRPAAWRKGELLLPDFIVANGDDFVLAQSYFNHQLEINYQGYVGSVGRLQTDLLLDGNIVVTPLTSGLIIAANGLVLRLRNGERIELAELHGGTLPVVSQDVLQLIRATPSTGTELFRYPFDTTITGNLYNDRNANLSKDSGERGLQGWRIYIDRNDNGRYDKGEINTLTDASGNFEFFELDAGTYKLRISTGANYQMTTGTVYTVKLKAGYNVRKKFGARAIV